MTCSRRVLAWLVPLLLLTMPSASFAEGGFLDRDNIQQAYPYPLSDGGETSDEPAPEDHWDVFLDEEKPEPEPAESRFELPGPFPIKVSAPYRHLLSAGPSFRNQQSRTELGAGFAYSNNVFADHPFQISVEPTWVRRKHQPSSDRNFRRVRTAASVQLWDRSSRYEGTSIAATGFFQNQNETFTETELGLAISQSIGRRLSISSNVFWRRDDPSGAPTVDAAVADFGASYNFGAGVRFGGFYELYNKVSKDDDWGLFASYQFLPFAEAIVDGGASQFVRARLVFSYNLD